MEILAGTMRSDNISSQKIPVEMDSYMSMEDESSYRFEALARRINGKKTVKNTKVEWMEHALYPNTLTVQAVAAKNATVVYVDHPEYAHIDQLIYNTRTGELYLMNEATGGTGTAGAITVLNHAAGTGGISTATAVGDVLLILPEAHAEGEDAPAPFTAKPRFLSTYVMQSDKSPGKYTDIAQATREYGEKQLLINRKQAWIYWKRGINLLYWFGKAVREVTSASGPRRHTMAGVNSFISTNRIDFGAVPGGLTTAAIAELMRKTSIKGASGVKVGIAGQNAWTSVSALPANAIRITQGEKAFGWVVNQLVTPFGNLALEYDPTLSAENGLAGIMAILDMRTVQPLGLEGLPERMYLDVTDARDIHNIEDLITGTYGLEMRLEELSAWGFGIN